MTSPARSRGSALVMAVLLTVMLATLSIVALNLVRTDTLLAQSGADGGQARAVAVAGANLIIGHLKNGRMDLPQALAGAADPTPYAADTPAAATWAAAKIVRAGSGVALGTTTLEDGRTADRVFDYQVDYPRPGLTDPNHGYIGPGDIAGWVVGRLVEGGADVATHRIDFTLKQELDALKAPLVLGGGGMDVGSSIRRVRKHNLLIDARQHSLKYHPLVYPQGVVYGAADTHVQFCAGPQASDVGNIDRLENFTNTDNSPILVPAALATATSRALPIQAYIQRLITGPPVPVESLSPSTADSRLDYDDAPWGTDQQPAITHVSGALDVGDNERLRGAGILLFTANAGDTAGIVVSNSAANMGLTQYAPTNVRMEKDLGGLTAAAATAYTGAGAAVLDELPALDTEENDRTTESGFAGARVQDLFDVPLPVAGRPQVTLSTIFDFDLSRERLAGSELRSTLTFSAKMYLTGTHNFMPPASADNADVVQFLNAQIEIRRRNPATGAISWEALDFDDFVSLASYGSDPGWSGTPEATTYCIGDPADLTATRTGTFVDDYTDADHILSIRVRLVYTPSRVATYPSIKPDLVMTFDYVHLDVDYTQRALEWDGLVIISGGDAQLDTDVHRSGPFRILGALMMSERYAASTGWADAKIGTFKIGANQSSAPDTELHYCPNALGQPADPLDALVHSDDATDRFRKVYPHARISLIDWRESPGGTAGP